MECVSTPCRMLAAPKAQKPMAAMESSGHRDFGPSFGASRTMIETIIGTSGIK